MLLNIIVIVLRETLEASILLSVMLSVSRHYRLGHTWLFMASLAGFSGATIFALNLGPISEMFDYMGQEVINAFLQYMIYLLLLIVCLAQYHGSLKFLSRLTILMGTAMAIAIVREGGELVVYYIGVIQSGAKTFTALTSGFIGFAIGMSTCALTFYGLAAFPFAQVRKVHVGLLCFIAAGMALQATQLLIQADWISAREAIWDSNWILPESSITGQIAYAVFGYEATPSLLELIVYVNAILLMIGLILLSKKWLANSSFEIKGQGGF